MWYTIIVVKGRETKIKEWLIIQWTLVFQKKIFQKLLKNPLTKFIKYDIIYTSKGDNPKKRKEEKTMAITNLTKEKNIVSIMLEGKTKPYIIDINTGTVYGLRGTPIKQIKINHTDFGRNINIKTWFNDILYSIFDGYGITPTYRFTDNLTALKIADSLTNLGVPYLHQYCKDYILMDIAPYLNDFIAFITRVSNGEKLNYNEWWREIQYKDFLKKHNFSADKISYETYKEIKDYPMILNNISHYSYCLERLHTIESFQRMATELYGYLDNRFSTKSILNKYYDCCDKLKKKPEKTTNLMREIQETINQYTLRKEEFDTIKMKENYDKHSKAFDFTYGDYTVVIPKTPTDIVDEGKNMHHCVGNYTKDVINNRTYIIFIRHKDTPDKCYITAQVSTTGNLGQYYLAYDQKISSVEDIEFKNALANHLLKNWQQ